MKRLALATAITAAAVVVLVAARRDGGSTAATPLSPVVHVAPHGSGDCSRADPCAWNQAMARARPGAVVELAAGGYRALRVTARHVTIRPTTGAAPSIDSFDVRASGVTLDHLRIGWMGITADRTRVVDSDIGGIVDRDPIQVNDGPTDVVIERNHIHDGARGKARGHVDCLQVTAASHVVIRGNDMRQCSNSALFLKPDLGDITDVVVEGNHLASCRPRSASCEGGVALFIRRARHGLGPVIVRGNDIVGTASLDTIPGVEVEGNSLDSWAKAPGCPSSADNEIRTRRQPACPLGPGDRYAEVSSR